jgi:hypothetical protein
MSIRVTFDLDGCSKQDAERWGELIIDACRLDRKVAMTLVGVVEHNSDGAGPGCERCGGTGVAPDGENECQACCYPEQEPKQ